MRTKPGIGLTPDPLFSRGLGYARLEAGVVPFCNINALALFLTCTGYW